MTEGRRLLGTVTEGGGARAHDVAAEPLAARALELLREELTVGDPAALQGACRFALRLGLVSPAEAREIFVASRTPDTDEGNTA